MLANGNRITTRNVVSLIYDPAGNLLGDQTTLGGATVNRTFTYTLAGQLRTVSINGTLRATYTYNHLSQRTRKVLASPAAGTPGTTLYRYDTQGRMVEEIAGTAATATGISVSAGQSLVTYVWKDDVPSAVIYGPSTPANPNNSQERIIYLHTDHLDTPRKATDAQARVVWSWTSDAFGSTAAIEDVDANGSPTSINLRFPGQYFDAESGLHYNWNRYYDPRSGRYTQSDPIGIDGGINTYTYVGGNPVSRSDPNGLLGLDTVLGGVVGGVSAYLGAASDPCTSTGQRIAAAATGAIVGAIAATVPVGGYIVAAGARNGVAGFVGNVVGQLTGENPVNLSQAAAQGTVGAASGLAGNIAAMSVGIGLVSAQSLGIGSSVAVATGLAVNAGIPTRFGGLRGASMNASSSCGCPR